MAACQVSFWETTEFKKEVHGKLVDMMSSGDVRTKCWENSLITTRERNRLNTIADPAEHNKNLLELLGKLSNEGFCTFRDEVLATHENNIYASLVVKMDEIEEKYDKVEQRPAEAKLLNSAARPSGPPAADPIRLGNPWNQKPFLDNRIRLLSKMGDIVTQRCRSQNLISALQLAEIKVEKPQHKANGVLLPILENSAKKFFKFREILRLEDEEYADILDDLDQIGPHRDDPACVELRQELQKYN